MYFIFVCSTCCLSDCSQDSRSGLLEFDNDLHFFFNPSIPPAAAPETAAPAPVASDPARACRRPGLPPFSPVAGTGPPAPHAPDDNPPAPRGPGWRQSAPDPPPARHSSAQPPRDSTPPLATVWPA